LDAWLGSIDALIRSELQQLLLDHPIIGDLLGGIAESSPYLWELVSREPARIAGFLQCDPDARFSEILAQTLTSIEAIADEGDASRILRRLKADAALLIALCDIGGVWPVMQVTRALTQCADMAVQSALRFLLRSTMAEGKFKSADPSCPERDCGYFVLAMGKMGAYELNYSSDIDLMVFFDPASQVLLPGIEPGPFFVRMTRSLVKLLQARTDDGYVFRVDLRLRPDPASTQIAMSTTAAIGYYESLGQNWERAALIKARSCAGDLSAAATFLDELAPFIWRKHLDYAAISDIQAMKRQIHAYKGHDEIAVEGHNIKLGRGGIREIEFFAQTQQLIAGGRHSELRDRATLVTLAALSAGSWIDAEAARELDEAYRFLRIVENRLQMIADEQTHTLPDKPEVLSQFARFSGFPDREAFAQILVSYLRIVQRHYAGLFEDDPTRRRTDRTLIFPAETDHHETLDTLTAMGFRQALIASATVRRWLSGHYRTLRGEFAQAEFSDLVPLLIEGVSRSEDPDRTLIAFDRFLSNLHGGVRLFSLMRRNPDLVALLVRVLGMAPRMADIVAQFPQVMDGLIDPSFFAMLPDAPKLRSRLDHAKAQSRSYEEFLDFTRIFGQENMFLIGTRILSGTVSAEQAGEAYARLADVLIQDLHGAVGDDFSRIYGRMEGQQSVVLALGKLGGREMTASSDLDLIMIYDFEQEHAESSGPRSLSGSQYFARLTHRLISALTAQTNYGALYHVDMRLRPSGRSGPVATHLVAFEQYQENEAWTWEHMALTRARVVSATPGFAERVEHVIKTVLCRPRDLDVLADDVVEMRRAIALEKGDRERWDLKYAAGGLIDLEFIAQYLQLAHASQHSGILDTSTAVAFEKAWRLNLIGPEDAEILRGASRLYHNLTQILRLCLNGPFDPKTAGAELPGLLARAADIPDFATLDAHLIEVQAKVRESFTRIIGRNP
jgi:glutamate-ammonia-ligase adenylyltransferase